MFQVGDRIKTTHWIMPQTDGWRYGTILEMVRSAVRVDWGSYTSSVNLRACAHIEKAETSQPETKATF